MTVQQVGEPSTLKGHPTFMQALNTAWHKASPATRASLSHCIFTDASGKVIRMGPIKDNPGLDPLIRTFADGKTYIGVGAWAGSPGNAKDNEQSSAGKGDKDIIVTYSDGDARPGEDPLPHLAATQEPTAEDAEPQLKTAAVDGEVKTEGLVVEGEVAHAAVKAAAAPTSGPGIILTNKSHKECTYYFYDNFWNGNGTAGANFDHPLKNVKLAAGAHTYVPLSTSFKGRVQRGTQIPCTWVEFQVSASNDGAAHGDISLEQGCDGAATIAATDGSGRKNGFTNDVLAGAPAAACMKRADGVKVLASTMGNWLGGPNQAAIAYLNNVVGQKKAYIVGGTGTDDVASKNKCLAVDMY